MFSISPNIRRITLPNNEQMLLEDVPKHKFDLYNENYYNANGVIEYEAPESKYKGEFIKVLEANRYEIIPLLDYHFQRSENPMLFFNYVKVDLSENTTLDTGIKKIIIEWLKVKRENSDTIVKQKPPVKKFSDIFNDANWEKYIDALHKTNPPLLNKDRVFIGKPRNHKGVICNWIRVLQNKHIIKNDINRKQLAEIVNREIRNLTIGKDGKSFHNDSYEFKEVFENQLFMLCGLK